MSLVTVSELVTKKQRDTLMFTSDTGVTGEFGQILYKFEDRPLKRGVRNSEPINIKMDLSPC